ncbi:MAG: hypothetical protein R3C45_04405 [Phycisphaerales bacterium]
MASLLERFADHENALWKKLSDELGGTLTDLKGSRHDKVVAKVGQWVVTLDMHSEPGYHAEHLTTRLRAPFVNPDGLRFMVRHQGIFDHLGKLVGMQDIKVDHEPFDKMFLIQGSDPAKIKSLFADERLRGLVKTEPNIHIQVRDAGNYFEDYFPDNVDELVLEVCDEVKDLDRLKRLFDLFARTLDDLCKIGSAYKA